MSPLASLILVCCGALSEPSVELFVSARAAPGGDGSRARPFATLEAARDALGARPRGAEAGADTGADTGADADANAGADADADADAERETDEHAPTRGITLLPGDYSIARSVVFGPEHGDLVLRAEPAGGARLLGAAQLLAPALRPVEDASVRANLPAAAREHVRVVTLPAGGAWAGPVQHGMGSPVRPVGSEVFCDGAALTRARWPDQGLANVARVLDPGSIPRNRADDIAPERRETGPARGGSFVPADTSRLAAWARASARAAGGDPARGPWAAGFWHWDWADEQLPVAEVDALQGTLRLGRPHRYGLRDEARFYVTNLIEELDSPGEFHLDIDAGLLYLWPPAGGVGELLISTLAEPLLAFEGTRHVRVEGLRLEATRGPALVARGVSDWRLEDVTVRNTGAQGLILQGRDNVVRRCRFEHTGAASIDVSGGRRETLEPGRNRVVENHVSGFGRVYRTYQPALKVSGVGQLVAHNELHDAPHAAILFEGNDHRIEANEIHDVLQETGDCGAIYCGRDWTMHGTVIRGNFIHDLPGTSGRWQNAIYLDDMASGIEVSGNLIFDCHLGMLIGGGRDLAIDANTFVACEQALSFDARGVGWMAPHLSDPQTSTLRRRWRAQALDEPPWSERFPSLLHYESDRMGRPVGSRVVGNRCFATPFGRLDDPECVEARDNSVLDERPDWIEADPAAHAGVRLGAGAAAWQDVGLRRR